MQLSEGLQNCLFGSPNHSTQSYRSEQLHSILCYTHASLIQVIGGLIQQDNVCVLEHGPELRRLYTSRQLSWNDMPLPLTKSVLLKSSRPPNKI